MECPACGSTNVTPSSTLDGSWNCMDCHYRWHAS